MEKNMNKKLNVFYDQDKDILYIAKDGKEEEFIEIYPGVNIELNEKKSSSDSKYWRHQEF